MNGETPTRPMTWDELVRENTRLKNEANALRKKNDTMRNLLYRLCSLNNTDPFDGARALLDARELLHELESRIAKESEANK